MRVVVRDRSRLVDAEPRTRAQLRAWVELALGVRVADRAASPDRTAPMDYLAHAFFEDHGGGEPRDCVVWAGRGTGKTFYAAVATALDLVFKPGIEVMILGGSLQQSQRMLAHLRRLFRTPALGPTVAGQITERRITLRSGSTVEVLAQSHTSVRGSRPQKLRCDEADLFHPDIWRAAQLVTRSKVCGDRVVRGTVEALSTWHRPTGPMASLIADAQLENGAPARRLFRWNVIDVLERCDAPRVCTSCALFPECGGRAKNVSFSCGHIAIDDAIALKRRSDEATWRAEMVCDRPVRCGAVYPRFDESIHVCSFPESACDGARMIGGIDFGFRDPTVVVWAWHAADDTVRIVDELVTRETTMDALVALIRGSRWPVPAWFGVDPAGLQRSSVSGMSPIFALRRAGLVIRTRRMAILEGIRMVAARLAPAAGAPSLVIHPRCSSLIASLRNYRYPDGAGDGTAPVKDGPDHAADALRYLVTNIDCGSGARGRAYSYL